MNKLHFFNPLVITTHLSWFFSLFTKMLGHALTSKYTHTIYWQMSQRPKTIQRKSYTFAWNQTGWLFFHRLRKSMEIANFFWYVPTLNNTLTFPKYTQTARVFQPKFILMWPGRTENILENLQLATTTIWDKKWSPQGTSSFSSTLSGITSANTTANSCEVNIPNGPCYLKGPLPLVNQPETWSGQ